jgi:hypothetical protein
MTDNNIVITINSDDDNFTEEHMNLDYINDFLSKVETDVDDLRTPYVLYYTENYTVKELIIICDYYGFSKEIKANKLGKELLIQCLVDYELDMDNAVIVEKRKKMWFYMNEIKNDKFMKKYVLW